MNTIKTKRTLLVAAGLVGTGWLLLSTPTPAQADPPRHAPAYGNRRGQDRWDDRGRDNRRRDDRRDWGRSRDSDRDGIPNYRDRNPFRNDRFGNRNRWGNDSWRRVDSDRDGVPNYRDSRPYDRRRR